MNNFKNNHRRNRYKMSGDRNFRKRNGNGHKSNGDFNSNSEFKRKNPGKNNQNAAKLVFKYKDLAREALSNGDKILSENYLQHADHFTRVLNEKENIKRERFSDNKSQENTNFSEVTKKPVDEISENNLSNISLNENDEEKVI